MTAKVKVLKTWPAVMLQNLQAFDPEVTQEPEYGPIIHTQFCWIYKHCGYFVVHNKQGEQCHRLFPNRKMAEIDVIIRFSGFNKNEDI